MNNSDDPDGGGMVMPSITMLDSTMGKGDLSIEDQKSAEFGREKTPDFVEK